MSPDKNSASTQCPEVDVCISHFEITQCLQLHDNSIPLVAGKPTVVRVIPRIDGGGTLDGVNARLFAFRNGEALEPFCGIGSSNGPITVGNDGWRGDPSKSLDFILEPSWYMEGDVEFLASLVLPAPTNNGDPVVDSNKGNNYRIYSAKFQPGQTLDLRYVVIVFDNDKAPGERVKSARTCGFLHSIMPMDPLELLYEASSVPVLYVKDQDGSGQIDDAQLIVELNRIFVRDGFADKLYGWTKERLFEHNGRSDPIYADGGGNVAFGNDTGIEDEPLTWRWRRTLAHEIGHNWGTDGLHHPSNDPSSSSYYPHHLQDDQFGYDVIGIDPFGRVVMRKMRDSDDDLYDFMVAGQAECEAWIGPSNYEQLFAADGVPRSTPNDAPPPTNPTYFMVDGVIRQGGGTGKVFPPLLIDRGLDDTQKVGTLVKRTDIARQTPRAAVGAEIRFYDGEKNEIPNLRIAWEPEFVDAEGHPADAWFSWITEIQSNVRRIELVYSENSISEFCIREIGPISELDFDGTPTATYNTESHALVIKWTTKDFDNGKPDFNIKFEYNGSPTGGPTGTQEENPFELLILDHPDKPDFIEIQLSRNVSERPPPARIEPDPPDAKTVGIRGRIISPVTRPNKRKIYRKGEHLLLIGYGFHAGRRVCADIAWMLYDVKKEKDLCLLGTEEKCVYRKSIEEGNYKIHLLIEGAIAATVDISVV